MSPRERYNEDEERVPAPSSTTSGSRIASNPMSNAHLAAKLSGSSSASTRRVPLQSRDPNTITGSYRSGSGNSTEEYNSKDFRFSHLESSNNECNRRFTNSTNSNSRNSSNTIPVRSYSTSELREGSDAGVSTQSRPNSYTKRSTSLPNLDEDSVIIEEHRRKINGEGYTLHRYLRGKMLGKGGFAKVYLCTALDTNKTYAIKIVPKANLSKARAREKLKAEIKIHRTLHHKHVCAFKHFFEDKTNCYILLELCHNQSMNEMIKRRKRLTEPETAFFMRQLMQATQYMHDVLVIHRDLKLGNLFLDRNMNIKVGDLGLATKLQSADEIRKTICGTPNYIAPEVIQGDRATRGHSFQVDIWSMGVIMFTCLVGKPPYEAKDVKATYQRIMANQYSFPANILISDHAKDLIVRMLQSKPADRPTLEAIASHPFLTSHFIPESLPSNATHIAPQWGKQSAISRPEIPKSVPMPSRRPFVARDANVRPTTIRDEKKKPFSTSGSSPIINVQGAVKDAWSAVTNFASPSRSASRQQSSKFQVFDENKVQQTSERDIVARTANLGIGSTTDETSSQAKSSHRRFDTVSSNTDSFTLNEMFDRVTIVLDIVSSRDYANVPADSQSLIPVSHGGPSKWVERYVDYTSKYGLGYLLSDGSSGVYFNDSKKAIVEAEGDNFQFVERKKSSDDSSRRSEPTVASHSLSKYPESLEKYVTLLRHFRKYLIEQRQKTDESSLPLRSSCDGNNGLQMVFLKKWVRTKHAIFFRLSDQTVQIVFYDHTEVLLTPDERYITYVDKNMTRRTYYLTDELVGCNNEIAKRLKYTKEILQQLVAGSPKR